MSGKPVRPAVWSPWDSPPFVATFYNPSARTVVAVSEQLYRVGIERQSPAMVDDARSLLDIAKRIEKDYQ